MKTLTPRLSTLFVAATLLAVVNVLLLVMVDTYDLRLGPLHLVAHGLFKPLLYVSGAVLATMLARSDRGNVTSGWSPPPWFSVLLVVILYLPSIAINPTTNTEWLHRNATSSIHSLGDLLGLFIWQRVRGT